MDSMMSVNETSLRVTEEAVENVGERAPGFIASEAIVSNEAREVAAYVINYSVTFLICITGITSNIIIIAVFYRQGYKETTNISLTAIAFWDLMKCVFGAAFRTTAIISTVSQIFQANHFLYVATLAFNFPSIYCTYVSSVLAGYVAVERCVSVSLPFTVKHLLTPRVVTTVVIALSTLTFGSFIVSFRIHGISRWYHARSNLTVAMIYVDSEKHQGALQFYNVIGFVWPILSLVVQFICTWVIAYHLRKSSLFRSNNARTLNADSAPTDKGMSSRDRQVTKMLLVIIIIYIVTMFPRLAKSIAKTAEPEFYMFRRFHNVFSIFLWVEHLFDYVNASVNIFIYYFMSTQFRGNLMEMIRQQKKT